MTLLPSGETRIDFSRHQVLVVDDSETMIELLTSVLTAFGVGKVHRAVDPDSAYEILRTNTIDCLIIDWVMHPTSGLTIANNVRFQDWKVNRKLPIIMCSAHTDLTHLRIALEAGVDEVLTKPISVASVFDKLYAALYLRRPFVVSDSYVGPEIRAKFWDPAGRTNDKHPTASPTVPDDAVFELEDDDSLVEL